MAFKLVDKKIDDAVPIRMVHTQVPYKAYSGSRKELATHMSLRSVANINGYLILHIAILALDQKLVIT